MKYNHAFTIAFSLTSNQKDGEDATPTMFRAAIEQRMKELDESPGKHKWREAVGALFDTYLEDEDGLPCIKCGAVPGTPEYGTVGDGFDGLCPSCADKKEIRSQIAAAISIGEGSDFAITKDDRLIVKTSQDEVIDLGSATKERMKELADYLNRLAHLANDA